MPSAFADLVASLLHKDASKRPGHALEVARVLGMVVPEQIRPIVFRAALVGRAPQQRLLDGHLERLVDGQGGMVILRGPRRRDGSSIGFDNSGCGG